MMCNVKVPMGTQYIHQAGVPFGQKLWRSCRVATGRAASGSRAARLLPLKDTRGLAPGCLRTCRSTRGARQSGQAARASPSGHHCIPSEAAIVRAAVTVGRMAGFCWRR
ncbi:hypothetical protein LPH50_04725 [Xylella taiwanensis]|uniref:Uncharacterized protein n=1 Tax=Xylella taiwanensis TaxID=1444770 RepID=A0ABS8TRN7_9GAMM|nr:hypothetical protein [Xylella taiwanensis]MCD8455281.1 hypothetical protein [Xylella taiwanensis]MCD8457688.1 hypothetical protein [Xylella taiwanensis]MCD8459825.1 hypothetical protein [Xylella taiwanensis]MCD8464114.1 hypothetical protein [Xylella taiwanensis]MCD8464328.1 hypothetical protein [Xylella taiwanensis]